MAEMWKPEPNTVYQEWITIIKQEEAPLDDKEISFIANVEQRILSGWYLTEAQATKLEQIYVRHT